MDKHFTLDFFENLINYMPYENIKNLHSNNSYILKFKVVFYTSLIFLIFFTIIFILIVFYIIFSQRFTKNYGFKYIFYNTGNTDNIDDIDYHSNYTGI